MTERGCHAELWTAINTFIRSQVNGALLDDFFTNLVIPGLRQKGSLRGLEIPPVLTGVIPLRGTNHEMVVSRTSRISMDKVGLYQAYVYRFARVIKYTDTGVVGNTIVEIVERRGLGGQRIIEEVTCNGTEDEIQTVNLLLALLDK